MSLGKNVARLARRLAAALIALALSGLPRVVPVALAHEGEHHCLCKAHGARHVCACRICRSRARAALRDAAEKAPPCHRGLALAEVAREEQDERVAGPCLRPTCGGEDASAPLPSTDTFTLPARPELVRAEGAHDLRRPAVAGADRGDAPPTPPPRA